MAALEQEPVEPGGAETEPPEDVDLSERPSTRLRRDADLLGRSNSKARSWLRERFNAIARGFEEQANRSDDLDQYWRCWSCDLDDNQFYNGNAEVYVPIIHDAIEARVTRFSNQLFPQAGRCVEVTTTSGEQPYEIVALLNHYIKCARFKTNVLAPLLRNGDIEGQYNLYVDWEEFKRVIVSREIRGSVVDGLSIEGVAEQIIDIKEEEITESQPCFDVLHDADVLVLPASADSIEQALACGGSVTIVRRWSKDKQKQMAADGEIGKEFVRDTGLTVDANFVGLRDTAKQLAKNIGIRVKGPHSIAFEVWQMVPLDEDGRFDEDGEKRLCKTWYDLDRSPMGAKRNPFWNDRCPLLSAPVKKVAGVFKGQSLVEPLVPLQYEANDAANERADADHYSAMPIIVRKPQEGGKPLVLNLAAVWDVDPNDVKFMAFPDLSQRANARVLAATTLIFQSLGINPAMLPQQTGRPGQKRNQAEVALEQNVDILTTAESTEVASESILTPVAEWMVDLDHQFRDRELTVRMWGEQGVMATMTDIPPLLNRTAYAFTWSGAQQAKMNAAMQQQGTAFINVMRGMRADLEAEGYQLKLGPLLEKQAINIFGGTTGALVLVDKRHQQTFPAPFEDELMAEGHPVPVHLLDNDAEHVQAHQQAMQQNGDPHGVYKLHITEHLGQMRVKTQAAQKQAMAAQMGAQGVPGGAGPGVAGSPRPGAVPMPPRGGQQPPGAVHQDRMPAAGVIQMPRKM